MEDEVAKNLIQFNPNNSGLLPSPNGAHNNGNDNLNRPQCQIYQKMGHLAIDCYHCMDYAYQSHHPPEKLAAMASTKFSNADTWYTDTGATNNLTPDIENLYLAEPYDGHDSIQVRNGQVSL
ncbi:hypothetical protein NE237_028496 [Protea cynaroides]|uniref:Uncharacterized protein n=1 Tax=Protea cynaroides TaxID=273540 RepID=A0A9Q0JSX3_9MAGN|nr:hypothetical protein NE237_028496 [Protea cynaroides]